MSLFQQKVIKPWGYELILCPPNSPVMGKYSYTKAGNRWSFQYHDQKEETICLLRGKAILWLENDKEKIEKIKMEPKKGYLIKPFKKHRFCAITDCVSIEISTPEKGNTIRLEDDYRRPTETEEIRKSPDRGWSGK